VNKSQKFVFLTMTSPSTQEKWGIAIKILSSKQQSSGWLVFRWVKIMFYPPLYLPLSAVTYLYHTYCFVGYHRSNSHAISCVIACSSNS